MNENQVFLVWTFSPRTLLGVFKTAELAQEWLDQSFDNGNLTAGEYDSMLIEPWPVYEHIE